MPTNQPTSIEPINSGNSGSEDESSSSAFDNIVSETSFDSIEIDKEDLETLTVDENTGEACNEYIPTLLETGVAAYKISPETTMFDYFCYQTIGADNYDDLDLTGYQKPQLVTGYFENIRMNSGTSYVAITEYPNDYQEDLYLACYLETTPTALEKYNIWDQINCDFTMVDSHVYFNPQKVLDPATNEFVLTDMQFGDHKMSEYYEELGNIQAWYGNNDYETREDFVDNTPTAADLGFTLVDYDPVLRVIEELQNIVAEDIQ